MKIDVVSDIACPWCAVGVWALDRALDALGGEFPVEVHFQPFELNPDMPPEGKETIPYLCAKYGIGPEQVRRNRQGIRDRGAEVGFTFGERPWVWNTFDAHRLLHWAGLEGRQGELKRALLTAYHGEDRNTSDHGVLRAIAGRCGLDERRAAAILASDTFAADVRAAEERWTSAGIHSVPSMVVDDRYLLQGAQSSQEYVRALRQIGTQG